MAVDGRGLAQRRKLPRPADFSSDLCGLASLTRQANTDPFRE